MFWKGAQLNESGVTATRARYKRFDRAQYPMALRQLVYLMKVISEDELSDMMNGFAANLHGLAQARQERYDLNRSFCLDT